MVMSICFSSMLDIGKLIPKSSGSYFTYSFSSMLDIGKLIPKAYRVMIALVLAQCWI